ncbi:hypothetical protein Tco_1406632 [Tanacetum coccineum]
MDNISTGQVYRLPVHQQVVNPTSDLQGPAPQTHGIFFVFYFRFWNSTMVTLLPNPKEDLKGSTTRSGVSFLDLKVSIMTPSVTKDTMLLLITESTETVQPPVVQYTSRNPDPEPNVAPVVTPIPKASIHFHQEEMMKGARKKLTIKSRNSMKSLEI